MTIAMLMHNTVRAAKLRYGLYGTLLRADPLL
jgi:hypothetical protein